MITRICAIFCATLFCLFGEGSYSISKSKRMDQSSKLSVTNLEANQLVTDNNSNTPSYACDALLDVVEKTTSRMKSKCLVCLLKYTKNFGLQFVVLHLVLC